MTTSINQDQATETVATNKLFQATITGAVLALAVNAILLYLGRAFGVPFELVPPGSVAMEPLGIGPLIGASILPAVCAAVLLALLPRYTPRPFTWFYTISIVVLILSFYGPANSLTDGPATVTGLNLMHVATALMIVGALGGIARKDVTPIQ